MVRHTPFLCNHCFKWNTSYTVPICWQCKHRKADTCFPAPILLLRDQYVFTVDEYREHSEFPIKQREELRTLKDAYDNAVAQETKEARASHTPKGKLKTIFKGGRGGEEQESIHDVYVARKKEIMDRKEDRHFLKSVHAERPALSGRVTGDAWQMELSTLIVRLLLTFISVYEFFNTTAIGIRQNRHPVHRSTEYQALGSRRSTLSLPHGFERHSRRQRSNYYT